MTEKLGSYKDFLEKKQLEPSEEAAQQYSEALYENRKAIAIALGYTTVRDLNEGKYTGLEALHRFKPSEFKLLESETVDA